MEVRSRLVPPRRLHRRWPPPFRRHPRGRRHFLWLGPAYPDASRRPIVLLHGFGDTAIWQWSRHLRRLRRSGFDFYVPDLLFFGASEAPGSDWSDAYQARCIIAAMEDLGLQRFSLVGVSYGGFVAYKMAATVERWCSAAPACASREGSRRGPLCRFERGLRGGDPFAPVAGKASSARPAVLRPPTAHNAVLLPPGLHTGDVH